MIVVDASVLTDFLLGRTRGVDLIEGTAALAGEPFHAPELIEVETLHALRGLARAGHVSDERAATAVARLGLVRRVLYPHGPFLQRAWELRHELTASDAMYLALAERIDAVLFTADRGLARRAKRLLGADRVQAI